MSWLLSVMSRVLAGTASLDKEAEMIAAFISKVSICCISLVTEASTAVIVSSLDDLESVIPEPSAKVTSVPVELFKVYGVPLPVKVRSVTPAPAVAEIVIVEPDAVTVSCVAP